jgi:hypothetical protein
MQCGLLYTLFLVLTSDNFHDDEECHVCGAERTLSCRNPCVICHPTTEVAESSTCVPTIFEAGTGQEGGKDCSFQY